jgi:MOSC domain-containing protein YiiM
MMRPAKTGCDRRMHAVIPLLFAGAVRPMPGDGRPTAIFKDPVTAPVWIGPEGFETDAQADRRVHGGPEKAVHQLPIENHRRLAAAFPEIADQFVAGALGENLSTEGLTDETVCIGDVYRLGEALLQVNQPRTPCWKIDARHGREGIAAHVEREGLAGWYFRVLQPGRAEPGHALERVARNPDPVSLREFHDLRQMRRPALAALQRVAMTPGLTPDWQRRLQQRIDWLRREG